MDSSFFGVTTATSARLAMPLALGNVDEIFAIFATVGRGASKSQIVHVVSWLWLRIAGDPFT